MNFKAKKDAYCFVIENGFEIGKLSLQFDDIYSCGLPLFSAVYNAFDGNG